MEIKEYFLLLCPYLLTTWLLFALGRLTGLVNPALAWQKVLVLLVSGLISLVPLGELSLAEYVLSVNPNFSIGSYALVLVGLAPYLTQKELLTGRQLQLFCLWSLIWSAVLYASYFNLVSYDLYAQGYRFSGWFLIPASLTVILLWGDSPLFWIFLAYIAAFNLKLLPSPNFFDYLTDGFLFLASLTLVVVAAVRQGRQGLRGAGHKLKVWQWPL